MSDFSIKAGGGIELRPGGTGSYEPVGSSNAAVGSHASGSNVHQIGGVQGLQTALDTKPTLDSTGRVASGQMGRAPQFGALRDLQQAHPDLTGAFATNTPVTPPNIFRVYSLIRASNVVTAIILSHDLQVGNTVRVLDTSDTTFNGDFVVASVNGSTVTWLQTATSATVGNGSAQIASAANKTSMDATATKLTAAIAASAATNVTPQLTASIPLAGPISIPGDTYFGGPSGVGYGQVGLIATGDHTLLKTSSTGSKLRSKIENITLSANRLDKGTNFAMELGDQWGQWVIRDVFIGASNKEANGLRMLGGNNNILQNFRVMESAGKHFELLSGPSGLSSITFEGGSFEAGYDGTIGAYVYGKGSRIDAYDDGTGNPPNPVVGYTSISFRGTQFERIGRVTVKASDVWFDSCAWNYGTDLVFDPRASRCAVRGGLNMANYIFPLGSAITVNSLWANWNIPTEVVVGDKYLKTTANHASDPSDSTYVPGFGREYVCLSHLRGSAMDQAEIRFTEAGNGGVSYVMTAVDTTLNTLTVAGDRRFRFPADAICYVGTTAYTVHANGPTYDGTSTVIPLTTSPTAATVGGNLASTIVDRSPTVKLHTMRAIQNFSDVGMDNYAYWSVMRTSTTSPRLVSKTWAKNGGTLPFSSSLPKWVPNVISNGTLKDFTSGVPTGWIKSAAISSISYDDTLFGGRGGIKLVGTGSAGAIEFNQRLPVRPGANYLLFAIVKDDNNVLTFNMGSSSDGRNFYKLARCGLGIDLGRGDGTKILVIGYQVPYWFPSTYHVVGLGNLASTVLPADGSVQVQCIGAVELDAQTSPMTYGPPTEGYWRVGDETRDVSNLAGGPTKWRCVTAGVAAANGSSFVGVEYRAPASGTSTGRPDIAGAITAVNLWGGSVTAAVYRGTTYLNTDTNELETWNGTAWVGPSAFVSQTQDWASLAAGATQSLVISSVTGAAIGDYVDVSMSISLQGTRLWAEVTAANTVTVYQQNPTGSAVDLPSGTLRVKTRRPA